MNTDKLCNLYRTPYVDWPSKRESWRYDSLIVSRKCRTCWAICESTTLGYKTVHRDYLKDNSAEIGPRNGSYSLVIWKKGEKKDSEALKGETWRQQSVLFL
jgi:hypothetical protein